MASVGAKRPLDTLAQLDQKPDDVRRGVLARRARAKYMTFPLAIALAELRTPLEKSYRNTVYCAIELTQENDGKITGKYCGNRWCLVCNRVRLARAINRYHGPLSAWRDPQFVTLTIPNVSGDTLKDTIVAMIRDVASIARAMNRTDGIKLQALRKIECTYNPIRNDFHPHFHLAVNGRNAAGVLVARWLDAHPTASPDAQDIRPCDEDSLMELFKYFTKLVVKARGASGGRAVAPVEALDVIFQAMRGRRVYQPIGFKVEIDPPDDEEADIGTSGDTEAAKRIGERVRWLWVQQVHDWVDRSTGEPLTGFEPSQALRRIVGANPNLPIIP